MNHVALFGNLGQDPELKKSGKGLSIAKIRLATTEGFGENKHTEWHNCVAFGAEADALSMAKKGDRVTVVGKLRTEMYEKDGQKRYSTSIIANAVGIARAFSGQRTEQKISPVTEEDVPF